MKKFFIIIIFILISTTFTCQRIDPETQGELQRIKITNLKGIPTEYGELISVTTSAQFQGWAQLWFVDQDSTIRMVRVAYFDNRIAEEVIVIPRN